MAKVCPCGNEITRNQYCTESQRQWEKRERSGFCRPKCQRIYGPQKVDRPKPSLSLVSARHDREEGKEQPKELPVVDEGYRRFVRGFPCLIPGCENPSIFHHQNRKGHGAKGALCSDYRGLNICEWHHTLGGTPHLPGSYHGMGELTGWRFWQHYGIDVEASIHSLNRLWLENGKKFKTRLWEKSA